MKTTMAGCLLSMIFLATGAGTLAQQCGWQNLSSGTSLTLSGITFPCHDTGYVIGHNVDCNPDQYIVLKTETAGDEWYEVAGDWAKSLWAIDFPTVNTGYAAGLYGDIMKSVDGGQNWLSLSSGTVNPIMDMHFFNANEGIAVGKFSTCIKTYDGGQTWVSCINGTSYAIMDVFFTNDSVGYATGYHHHQSGGMVLRSNDRGQTWTYINVGTNYPLCASWFFSPDSGFVCGANGTLLYTWDGGAHFYCSFSGVNVNLHTIWFTDKLTGYAAGDLGTMIKTTDGGMTWSPCNTNSVDGIHDIFFINDQVALASGENGSLLLTNSAGEPTSVPEHQFQQVEISIADGYLLLNSESSIEGMVIYDINGRLIDQRAGLPAGSNRVALPPAALRSNILIVQLIDRGLSASCKLPIR